MFIGIILGAGITGIIWYFCRKSRFFSSYIFRYSGHLQGVNRFRKKVLKNIPELKEYKIFVFRGQHELFSYPEKNKKYSDTEHAEIHHLIEKSIHKPVSLDSQFLASFLSSDSFSHGYAYGYSMPIFDCRVLICTIYQSNIKNSQTLQDQIQYVNDTTAILAFLSEAGYGQHHTLEVLQEIIWDSPYAIGVSTPKGDLISGNSALYQLFHGAVPNFCDLIEHEIFILLLDGKKIGKTFTHRGRRIRVEGYPLNNKNFLITKCLFVFFDEQVETKRDMLGESNTLRRFTSERPSMGTAMFTTEGTLLYSNDSFMKNLHILKVREGKQKDIYDLFEITEIKFQEIVTFILNGQDYDCILTSLDRDFEFNTHFRGVIFGDQTILELALDIDSSAEESASYLDQETKELYEELHTARSVQEHILSLPTIYQPGIDVDTLYIPSRQLSGDFFTVVPFGDDHMGFLIADVSGHGVSASLITAALKILIEFAPNEPDGLPKIIAYLNTYLADILPEGSFVTLFYGILNCHDYTFKYINCGHPFPVLEDQETGITSILDGMSFPLGGLLNVSFDTHIHTVHLPEKSKLFFYTDGILQHLPGNMNEKLDRIRDVIEKSKKVNRQAELEHIYHKLVERHSSIPEDDVSMMQVALDKKRICKHSVYISSTLIEVDIAIEKIGEYIQKITQINSQIYWRMHTCFYEALLNAVVHGNKYNTQKKVYIAFRITSDLIVIKIRDKGTGFNQNELPDPFDQSNILKAYGRGLTMIRSLADHTKHNKTGNEITLFFFRHGKNTEPN